MPLATLRELIMDYISVLRLRTPPLIRTEKELSDKVQLLEVRRVNWEVLLCGSKSLHIDPVSHLVRLWETLKLPLSW